jgi:hypothetical protein
LFEGWIFDGDDEDDEEEEEEEEGEELELEFAGLLLGTLGTLGERCILLLVDIL